MSTWMSSVGAERTGLAIVVFVGHAVGPAGSSLTPRATILSAPSGSGRCSFQRLVRRRHHPDFDLIRGRQDHRHRLWVDGADLGVWVLLSGTRSQG
jgi:hypothetical protein